MFCRKRVFGFGALLVGLRKQTISRRSLWCARADCIHRFGRIADKPIEEYLIELFLASSARSFATYSSDCMLAIEHDSMAIQVCMLDLFVCPYIHLLPSELSSRSSAMVR